MNQPLDEFESGTIEHMGQNPAGLEDYVSVTVGQRVEGAGDIIFAGDRIWTSTPRGGSRDRKNQGPDARAVLETRHTCTESQEA